MSRLFCSIFRVQRVQEILLKRYYSGVRRRDWVYFDKFKPNHFTDISEPNMMKVYQEYTLHQSSGGLCLKDIPQKYEQILIQNEFFF